MVRFGYIIVNTLHKGDNKDDDDVDIIITYFASAGKESDSKS
jgi:hypothetical protein